MRGTFEVKITLQGKPLPAVVVRVIDERDSEVRLLRTGADGIAKVSNLPPGQYSLGTDLFGTPAGGECFHISKRTSLRAKQRITYDWGDSAYETRAVAGRAIDHQPGNETNPLMRYLNAVEAPVAGAGIALRNIVTGEVRFTTTPQNGAFEFPGIEEGFYVLQAVETSIGLHVTRKGTRSRLIIDTHVLNAGIGSCGKGASIWLE